MSTTRLTKIGNSYGVILPRKILKEAGLTDLQEFSIELKKGTIMLTPVKKKIVVNLDTTTWDAQFKKANKLNKHQQDDEVWPDHLSSQADKDWTW